MDFLVAASDDHINNFNATEGAIMLMQNSGTSSFGYRASLDGKMHYNYTIQYIEGAYLTLKLPDRTQINKWLQMDIIVIGL